MSKQITFIGGGNMANSIIGGLVAKGEPADRILVCEPQADNRHQLEETHGVATSEDNAQGARRAEVLVLAVKPQIMQSVCETLRGALSHQPLVVSIAAGIPQDKLQSWLGREQAVVRCMPNTPALVQAGASVLHANARVTSAQCQSAEEIMSAAGLVEWIEDEALMDAVTAVSGSGPAYFFLFMEAMIDAAVDQGLPRDTAERLAIQTCLGAGKLAGEGDADVAELRRRVCSPGGTTLKAVESFQSDHLPDSVARAMAACAARAREMAEEL